MLMEYKHHEISNFLDLRGKIKIILRHEFTKEKLIYRYSNLVVTVAKEMVMSRLAGEENDCNITYLAVGTDSTTPAVGDTTLGTEVDRKVLSNITAVGRTISYSTFFALDEGNGVLKEMGLFGEAASAAADSGTMFNHALINLTKTDEYTMTIQGILTAL